MHATLNIPREPSVPFHYKRSRLNDLFWEAINYPLVLVCAGSGYGKTSAVLDFITDRPDSSAWLQLSELDNAGTRFWKKYLQAVSYLDQSTLQLMERFGFPDSEDKMNRYFESIRAHVSKRRKIQVMDDFHLIEDPSVLHFVERGIQNLLPGMSLFLLTRSMPSIIRR